MPEAAGNVRRESHFETIPEVYLLERELLTRKIVNPALTNLLAVRLESRVSERRIIGRIVTNAFQAAILRGVWFMRKSITLAGSVAALLSASPAWAGVFICAGSNCVSTDENVLVDASTGATINGNTNNTNVAVTFTSTTDPSLVGSANGQADVSSADGLLNGLTFSLEPGFGFKTASFNLFPLPGNANNEATTVFLTYVLDGVAYQISQAINTNGQNFFGIYGTSGEVFTSGGFLSSPTSTGIQDLRQLRLGGVAAISAVPEPATWALLLLGFGAIGFGMRRRKGQRSHPRVRIAYA